MKTGRYQRFTFLIENDLTDKIVNAIFDAGCDDCTPCSRFGSSFLHFDRIAKTKKAAIASAKKDLRKAGIKILADLVCDEERQNRTSQVVRLRQAIRESHKMLGMEFHPGILTVEMLDGHQIQLKDFKVSDEMDFLVVYLEHMHPIVFLKDDLNFWTEDSRWVKKSSHYAAAKSYR